MNVNVKYLRPFWGLLLLSVLNLYLGAEAPSGIKKQAEGIDIILLLDESGSMGGSGKHPGKNDPYRKRDQLMEILLPDLLYSSETGFVHRISVIEFGSRFGSEVRWQAQVTLSCYKIPDRRSSETKDNYYKRVYTELDFLSRERNRGDSDHGEALRLALEEIRKMEGNAIPPPLGKTGVDQRPRVIFMITDGQPYVKDPSKAATGTAALKEEIRNIINGFPAGSVILYVFGLNSSDDYWFAGDYGKFWDDAAAATHDDKGRKGGSQFIPHHHKIIEQILPVLSLYTSTPPYKKVKILEGNKYDCPPYLKSVEFLIEFPRAYMDMEGSITITPPDGPAIPLDRFQVHKNYAAVTIPYPVAGIWTLDRESDIRVLYKEKLETVEYLSPLSPVPIASSRRVAFKAYGGGPDHSFVPLDNYPVQGKITIQTPDNKKDVLDAVLDPGNPGVFITSTPYKFNQEGTCQIQFQGSVITGSGEEMIVLESLSRQITVTLVQPLNIHLEKPVSLISTFGSIRQTAEFGFYSNKMKIPLDKVLKSDSPIELEIVIFKSPGKILAQKNITLTRENNLLKGTITEKISLMPAILGQVEALLTIKMDNRSIQGDYFLEESKSASGLQQFTLKVRERIWIYLLILTGGLLILLIIAAVLFSLFWGNRCLAGSKQIPVLVYRHGLKINPDKTVEKILEVYKRKVIVKPDEISFAIAGSDKTWKSHISIINHCAPRGVRLTVKYEIFAAAPGGNDEQKFEEAILETTDNYDTDKHDIKGLEDHHMIFELKIKEN